MLRWLSRVSPQAERRLLCCPPSGGMPGGYRGWGERLGAEVWTVVLPGRDRRMGEPAAKDVAEVVDAVMGEWAQLPAAPFAFYGHSLGGGVAYELCRALEKAGAPLPERLIVVASAAPGVAPRPPRLSDLPHDEFLAMLRESGGTPEEFFEEPELIALFVPILRAELKLADDYRATPGPPLPLPIHGFAGTRDKIILAAEMEPWAAATSRGFTLERLDGDHYFALQPDFVGRVAAALGWA